MSKEYWKPGNMLYPVPAVMISCGRPGEIPNIITMGGHHLFRSGAGVHFREKRETFP